MNLTHISSLRLTNQQLAGTRFTSPKDIVTWMGAMQAQDYAMVKWAMGIRLPGATDASVEAAVDNGDIIRTHVLRPTWHFVSAEDVRWMLALTAPQLKKGLTGRHRDLGLTDSILAKSRKVLEQALRDGNHATRAELIVKFKKANIATDENRASHLFVAAELDLLICSGKTKNGKQTFSLLDEWVPTTKPKSRDEALASLARRYFMSHGPATLADFVWWSGLSVSAARLALEMVKPDFVSETIASKMYFFSASSGASRKDSAYLLPAYDEFIISYTDRSATLTFENHKRTVSSNGIFRPTVVINGQTIGIWKRTFKKDLVMMEFEYFKKPGKAILDLLEDASNRYGMFLRKKINFIQNNLK